MILLLTKITTILQILIENYSTLYPAAYFCGIIMHSGWGVFFFQANDCAVANIAELKVSEWSLTASKELRTSSIFCSYVARALKTLQAIIVLYSFQIKGH